MAIYGEKLIDLLEQEMNAPANTGRPFNGLNAYKRKIRQFLGITENAADGGLTIDKSKAECHASEFSIGELSHAFFGRHWRGKQNEIARMVAAAQTFRVMEHEGHVVLPSNFANISAWTDTVGGLIDAQVIEGYENPEYIADKLFSAKDTRMNGGKLIGVLNDGQYGDELNDAEPYPTVGLKETYVDIPDNQRRGNTIQMNMKDFMFDRTDTMRDKALKSGEAVRRGKEVKQADCFLGVTNTYARDGSTSNTYRPTAGTTPNNFVNTSVNTLNDFTDIDEAVQVLEGNLDPGTGWEIQIPEPFDVAVMPHQWLELESITKATEVETRNGSNTNIRRYNNPLYRVNPIRLSRLFYNRMLAAAPTGTYAQNRWWVGDFKKTFQYRTLVPFQSNEAPLSSEDVRRDIILIRVAMEHGVPLTGEPRFTYMGSEEVVS